MKKITCLLLICLSALTIAGCGKKTYSVELIECGNTPIKLVKAVQEITNYGVKDAKSIVDNVPSIVIEGVTESEALQYKEMLEEASGIVVIK